MVKTAKTAAPPATWEQFSAVLDAGYAALGPGWATFVDEDLARRAVIDAQEGRASTAFERLDAIRGVTRRALGACELALAFDALGDAEKAARALSSALAMMDLGHDETARSAVYGQMAYVLEALRRPDEAAVWASRAREHLGSYNNAGENVRALARYLLLRGECDEATRLIVECGLSGSVAFHRPYVEAHIEGLLARRAWPALFALGRAQTDIYDAANAVRRCVPAMLAAGEVDALLALLASAGHQRSAPWNDLADHAERLGLTDVLRRAAEMVFAESAPWSETPVLFLKWLAPLDDARARAELSRRVEHWLKGDRPREESWGRNWLIDELAAAYARLGLLDRAVALVDRNGEPARLALAVRFLHRDGRAQERDAMLDRMASQGRAAAPALAATTLMRVAASAAECGQRDRARGLLDEVFAAVASKAVTDGDVARDVVNGFLAMDDIAGAWKAYRKVSGKYRKESALQALLAWSGTHDDPTTALDALERYVKERPNDVNPLRHGFDAFEASRARRGLRVMINVF